MTCAVSQSFVPEWGVWDLAFVKQDLRSCPRSDCNPKMLQIASASDKADTLVGDVTNDDLLCALTEQYMKPPRRLLQASHVSHIAV